MSTSCVRAFCFFPFRPWAVLTTSGPCGVRCISASHPHSADHYCDDQNLPTITSPTTQPASAATPPGFTAEISAPKYCRSARENSSCIPIVPCAQGGAPKKAEYKVRDAAGRGEWGQGKRLEPQISKITVRSNFQFQNYESVSVRLGPYALDGDVLWRALPMGGSCGVRVYLDLQMAECRERLYAS